MARKEKHQKNRNFNLHFDQSGSDLSPRLKQNSSRGNDGRHLINFRYQTAPSHLDEKIPSTLGTRRSKPSRSRNASKGTLSTKYKLVLHPSVLSTNPPWLVNPDIPIPWSEVRAVISFDRSSSGFQESLPCRIGSLDDYSPCPICLDSPILPVMTHCGHIYCTCCILRYMNQEFHRKCPICSVAISRSDLKEIIAPSFPLRHTLAPLRPQSSATFSLVIKLTGSLSPFRASILTDTTNPTHILCCPPSCSSLDIIYSRACLASHEELLSLRENRIQEILRYREACLASVKEKLDHEREIRSTSLAQKSKIRSRGWEQIDSLQLSEPIISVSTSSVDPITTHGDVENLPFLSEAEDLIRKEIIAESSQTSTMSQIGFSDMLRREDLVYSYQLAPDISDMEDIQIDPPTFLHPFCVRCLVSDLNNSEAIDSLSGLLSLPHIIAGKVLEVSTETVTEVGRKRYPFLRHLPLDSLYQLIEIDMVDCLSTKTYERYRGEFHNRNLKRQERILEEERTEKFYRERQEILERLEVNDRKEFYARQQEIQREAISSLLQGPSLNETDIVTEEHVPALPESSSGSCDSLKLSFATVTQMGGNFPTLSDASKQPNKLPSQKKSKNCWGLPENPRQNSSNDRQHRTAQPRSER